MNERAIFALAILCIVAFGILWGGAWWVLGFPLALCIAGAFVSGVAVMYAAERRERG